MKKNWFWKTLPLDVGVDIRVKIFDGEQIIHIDLDEMDVINGKPRSPQRCVGGNGCMRHAKDGTFPHPVIAAWFERATVYVLTKSRASTNNYAAVRYRHPYSKYVDIFDRTCKWTGPMSFTLYPPGKSHTIGGDTRIGRSGLHNKTPTGKTGAPRGVRARKNFLSRENWENDMRLAGYTVLRNNRDQRA